MLTIDRAKIEHAEGKSRSMTIPAIHTKISTSAAVVTETKICIGVPTSTTWIRRGKHIPVNNAGIVHLQPFRLPELGQHIHRAISVICLTRLPEPPCNYWT
jgi:hypothetical protein